MALMRICPECGQAKELRGNFHYNRDTKKYNAICKECEAADDTRIRELAQKANLKSYIQKSWTRLCSIIDEKEMDMILFNLREIYYNHKQ